MSNKSLKRNSASFHLRESLRKRSLSFLLSENLLFEREDEDEDFSDDATVVTNSRENKTADSNLTDEEFDNLGSDLQKMYTKTDEKLAKLLKSFSSVPEKMRRTFSLMSIASKRLKKVIADPENLESAQFYAAAETFMNSFAFLMINIRKSTRSMTDDQNVLLDSSTTLEKAFGEDLKDIVSSKFMNSIGFRERMVSKMKPYAEYYKNIASRGQASESAVRYDDVLLENDLFEVTELNKQILTEAGFFQSLVKLFGGDGKYTFKGFMKGLFKTDPKDVKGSVKSMLPLFGGKNIARALLDDLLEMTIKDVKTLLDSNVTFYKETLQPPSKEQNQQQRQTSDSTKSAPAPTKQQVQSVKKLDSDEKEKISSELEQEYGPKITKAFTDIVMGRKTLDQFDGKMKNILSVIINDLSTQARDTKESENKSEDIGDVGKIVEKDGKKMVSLGLDKSKMSQKEKKEVLEKIKKSIINDDELKLAKNGHIVKDEYAAMGSINHSLKSLLGNDVEDDDRSQELRKKIADSLTEQRIKREDLYLKRWQKLAGLSGESK